VIVPASIVIVAGLAVAWVAVVSWQGRLRRNGFAGVRTPATMRSDEAFRVANKVAAPLTGLGGAVLTVSGVLAAVLPKSAAGVPLFGGVTLFLVLCAAGAARGIRACKQPG